MVKPLNILKFILFVFGILFLISLSAPKEDIKISKSLNLRFPRLKDIFNPKKIEYADISEIVNKHRVINDTALVKDFKEKSIKEETLVFDTIRANESSLENTLTLSNSQKIRKISYGHSLRVFIN